MLVGIHKGRKEGFVPQLDSLCGGVPLRQFISHIFDDSVLLNQIPKDFVFFINRQDTSTKTSHFIYLSTIRRVQLGKLIIVIDFHNVAFFALPNLHGIAFFAQH